MFKFLFLIACLQLAAYPTQGRSVTGEGPPPPGQCAVMFCVQNTRCIDEPDTNCTNPPCPPVGRCVPLDEVTTTSPNSSTSSSYNCVDKNCKDGETCEHAMVKCIRAPCPQITRCIKKPSITCANVRCAGGPCVMEDKCDDSGSCTQHPVCKKREETEQ